MKSIAVVFGLLLAALIGWYEASPRHTLNEMRKAAAAGNGAKLSKYVDYQSLKIDLKDELRREILLEANRRGSSSDPVLKLGADLAVALVRPGVDLLVTPEAVEAMFDVNSAASRAGRGPGSWNRGGGAGVMPVAIPKTGVVIERNGFNEFKVRTKREAGAAVFRRHGFGWKLTGFDMPYRFGAGEK